MFFDMFRQGPHIMPKEIRSWKKQDSEIKEAPLTNIFRKPFMPTTWKWFRTQGTPKVYTFRARRGEITNLELNVPKQYRKFIVSTNGEVYPSNNGNLKIKMEGDTGDYITLGGRETVTMLDAEPEGICFPKTENYQEVPLVRIGDIQEAVSRPLVLQVLLIKI